jgi:alkanesulfonate monooxygenase SsuD/methylene tetrahydromethanopterin reductase-like flavin-dependent oxidoreductase (luciferase family)
VKALWFHLMPYPGLDERFDREAHSVWVDLDASYLDPELVARSYREYLGQLEHGARTGFDGICVNEHHQTAYGTMPSPNLMAAVLARETARAAPQTAIVVMGNSIALYQPPIRVAEELAMLDLLSEGRLVAGLPVGTAMDTCYSYGTVPGQLRARYAEAHDLIVAAWKSEGPFAFNGRYTKLRYVNPWPRPLQRPHPPIWLPGGGSSVETWDLAVTHDYVYAYLSYYGYEQGKATMDGFWDYATSRGRDDNPYRTAFLQFVTVADSDAEARRLYREPVEYFYRRGLKIAPGFAGAPGYQSETTFRSGLASQVRRAARAVGSAPPTFDEIVDRGWVIAGSPETVRERLEHSITELRFGHLLCLMHIGNMADELVRMNTELFAGKVLPKLRDQWPGYEDRWWPQGCA